MNVVQAQKACVVPIVRSITFSILYRVPECHQITLQVKVFILYLFVEGGGNDDS